MKSTIRINLKLNEEKRKELMDFCLKNSKKQYLAIGWSGVYTNKTNIDSYEKYYNEVVKLLKKEGKKTNTVLNKFRDSKENDLYWTRDLEGNYWICRVKDKARNYCDEDLDIGAIIPVEAYKYGLNVPGQIKASFNRKNGGTAAFIWDDAITEFSKAVYNKLAEEDEYEVEIKENDLISNLPEFDLEELVISYLQIKKNYYLLSNSIAQKSTTPMIECVLFSRKKGHKEKAVVQVKAKGGIEEKDYEEYLKDGYNVYLYNGGEEVNNKKDNIIYITKDELLKFCKDYKNNLPESILLWKDLFKSVWEIEKNN